MWRNLSPFDQAIYNECYIAACHIAKAGFNLASSDYREDIEAGKVPRLKWQFQNTEVPSLFTLTKDKIRHELVLANKNVNSKILEKLPIPNRLKHSLYSADNGHGGNSLQ